MATGEMPSVVMVILPLGGADTAGQDTEDTYKTVRN